MEAFRRADDRLRKATKRAMPAEFAEYMVTANAWALREGQVSRADLLLEDDNGCELEEQPVRCEMLRQAFRSLSATVPGRRQEEAGLQDGVELEEVPEEQDHWDPAKRAITLSRVNQKQEVYSGKKEGATVRLNASLTGETTFPYFASIRQ